LSGLAVGALVGIVLNALLPLEEKEYKGLNKDQVNEDDEAVNRKSGKKS
jgi:xanthine/uracil permease